jgi:hypothetical protein
MTEWLLLVALLTAGALIVDHKLYGGLNDD